MKRGVLPVDLDPDEPAAPTDMLLEHVQQLDNLAVTRHGNGDKMFAVAGLDRLRGEVREDTEKPSADSGLAASIVSVRTSRAPFPRTWIEVGLGEEDNQLALDTS